MTWTAKIVTLFPEVFPGVLGHSLPGKALARKDWILQTFDLRQFGTGPHCRVDDAPIGGGPGMVMKPDVLEAALAGAMTDIDSAALSWPVVALSPRGRPFDQKMAREWAHGNGVTMICGRYEGIDERFLTDPGIEEVSLGDFVLAGGEVAAQAMIEATVRLLPRVLGNEESPRDETFSDCLLEYPQYTKPNEWKGQSVPEILFSGHHERIAQWRQQQAEALTRVRRPDLWRRHSSHQRVET